MKKKYYPFIFLVVLLHGLVIYSFGQGISLGVKAGIAIPNLKAPSSDNPVNTGWTSRLGPYFGFVAGFDISEKLSIQAELNYASQGGKKKGLQAVPGSAFADMVPPGFPLPDYLYADFNAEAKLNYIELPVMLKLSLPIGETASFFVNAGPYAGFLVSAKNVSNGASNVYADKGLTQPLTTEPVSFDTTQDIKDDISKLNAGIQLGVGFALNFGNGSLFLTGGGNYGLTNIQKDPANGKNHTGAATVTLGYLIRL